MRDVERRKKLSFSMCNIFRYDKYPVAPVFAKCAVRVYLGRFEDNEIMIENNIPVNCAVLRDL